MRLMAFFKFFNARSGIHHSRRRRFAGRHLTALISAILIGSAGLAVSAKILLGKHKEADPSILFRSDINLVTDSAPALSQSQTQVRAERITIRPTGFDPTEITRAQGRFMLAVDNQSGLDTLTLRLAREGGNRVREMRLSPEQSNWREKVNLPPGNYLLTEASHANWLCRITITP